MKTICEKFSNPKSFNKGLHSLLFNCKVRKERLFSLFVLKTDALPEN